MNGDILPPRKPRSADSPLLTDQPVPAVEEGGDAPQVPLQLPTPVAEEVSSVELPDAALQPRKRRIWLWSVMCVILVLLLVAGGAVLWYVQALRPVDAQATERVRVSVVEQSRARDIGQLLYDKHLIRSTLAFDIYTRLSGTRNELKAGSYNLSANESTQEVVEHLVAGQADTVTLTFYPGATLRDGTDTPEEKKTDVTTILLRAGYAQAEIDAALAKQYDHPLFDGKPASASLEGYVYGETYNFNSDATVEEILTHTFDIFYQKIEEQNIIEPLKQRGMSLYQGIVLASIVQREVSSSNANEASPDQRQVAQVFYSRLEMNMPLGSDVTAYYGADQIGAMRSVEVDTPYNTRKHAGLTPGPIATPAIGALVAVATPAPGDFLYFLSGDDHVTYFARTDAEHEANIRNHCHVKCAIP
jgi:UPF0755 protein